MVRPGERRERFIKKAQQKHGERYDYSKVIYRGSWTKVDIVCPVHGVFEQAPANHLSGMGCQVCGGLKRAANYSYSTEEFIIKAKTVHGDKYDYSKVLYKRHDQKVTIACSNHGEFEQIPASHLAGKGCIKCANGRSNRRSTSEEFISKAKVIFGGKYDYSKVAYEDSKRKVTIICPSHGEFQQSPNAHLHGYQCPRCAISLRKKTAKSESEVKEILTRLELRFEAQKTFETCTNPKTKAKLAFDYFLPDVHLLIERQGEQHYVPVRWSSNWSVAQTLKKLEEVQARDRLKQEWANDNGYDLLTIPFWEEDAEEYIVSHLQRLQTLADKVALCTT